MSYDDYEIESLAAYLHVSPEQVRKMAERGKLPGRKVGGQWKFSRAEIHHWFEEKIGLSDEQELIEVQRMLDQHGLANSSHSDASGEFISELLTVDRIALPLGARTKNSVIEKICRFSAEAGVLWQPVEMADALRSREELHPTALENGVALLHPRRPNPAFFAEPFLTMGITSSGIPFGGPRGCLTDIFFLIASPDEAFHLRVLARLSRLVQKEELLANIRAASSPAEVWHAIHETDNEI